MNVVYVVYAYIVKQTSEIYMYEMAKDCTLPISHATNVRQFLS